MKMKKIIIVLLLIAISKIQAQNYFGFPDSNAVWNTYYADMFYAYNINPYFVKGDTTFNGQTYKKVYQSADTFVNPFNCNLSLLVRDTNQQWLFFNFFNQSEDVLYDFGLEVGDTFEINLDGNPSIYVVSQIDSILLAGQYRKRMYMSNFDQFNPIEWIEGIGSSKGLIVPYHTLTCGGYNLICFHENDVLIYSGSDSSCWFSEYVNNVGTEKFESGKGLKIYPNPAKDKIKIEFNDICENCRVQIFDILGRYQSSEIKFSSNIIEIARSELLSGMYFLRIESANGFWTERIVWE